MRFIGKTEAKLDSKGRVFLPATFRKELQGSTADKLVLRKDVFSDCLVLYTDDVWNNQMETLRNKLNRWNKAHQQVFRQFVAEAEIVQREASGRILLPKRCMQSVNIDQNVMFIGMGDTIEIWPKPEEPTAFLDDNTFSYAIESLMAEDKRQTKENDQKEMEE